MEELEALIGLRMCDGIGDVTANKLLLHCGSAVAVFKEKSKHLSSIHGISAGVAAALSNEVDWKRVYKEAEFIIKNNIRVVSILDSLYPSLLQKTDSPPTLVFFRGDIGILNSKKCISIVGTRAPSHYGQDITEQLVSLFKDLDVIVVSGLAVGIDITAHRACLNHHLPTFGVVGHGLKTIYPHHHKPYVDEILHQNGGVLSEFFSDMIPNRENFPKRNRIIAGISEATIVIEASKKSGTIITAQYALDYKRKVFVLPGRITDKLSEGCNNLLNNRNVRPIISLTQLIDDLGFKTNFKRLVPSCIDLNVEEAALLKNFSNSTKIGLEDLASLSQISIGSCVSILLSLEMKGLIKSLPGSSYELC